MEKTYVFVYCKNKKIKVLSLSDSLEQHNSLITDGWTHTETLNPCVFLEYLHNECVNIALICEEVLSLSEVNSV